jgi:homogentisate 1,2-dioxygenase
VQVESNFSTLNPKVHVSPTQLAWTPFKMPEEGSKVDFIDGIKTCAGSGEPSQKDGIAVHVCTSPIPSLYRIKPHTQFEDMCNTSMTRRAFCNNDGHMLIVPELGRLDVQTELGNLMVHNGEICVIPRGIRFRVALPDGQARGYIQEVFGAAYELPERGPLGRSGLALERDFEYPVAAFELDQEGQCELKYVSVSFPYVSSLDRLAYRV